MVTGRIVDEMWRRARVKLAYAAGELNDAHTEFQEAVKNEQEAFSHLDLEAKPELWHTHIIPEAWGQIVPDMIDEVLEQWLRDAQAKDAFVRIIAPPHAVIKEGRETPLSELDLFHFRYTLNAYRIAHSFLYERNGKYKLIKHCDIDPRRLGVLDEPV